MKNLNHYMIPKLTEQLYEREARSSIALTKVGADKINEVIDAVNNLYKERLTKYQEQDGKIQGAILYMKDNLANTLYDMLEIMKSSGDFDNIIKDVIEPAILMLENKTEGTISVKSYGAAGTGLKDDTQALQKAIDYAREHNKAVYIPAGTYRITAALKVYDGMHIIGDGAKNTKIERVGTGDAAIMLCLDPSSDRDYTQGQKIKELTITCDNTIKYGIYSETPCPFTEIDNVNINNAVNGIYLKNGAWLARITNINISDCETGIYYGNTGTSTIIENIYVIRASKVGYDLNGLTYSDLKNLACDWCTGIPYKFNFCFLTVNGLGSESKDATTAIWMNNSYISIDGAFVFALENETSKYIYGNGGWLKITNGAFGQNGNSKAKFIDAGGDFNVDISGVKLENIETSSSSYGEHNIVKLDTGKGSYMVAPFDAYPFIGSHHTQMMDPAKIGYDYPMPGIYGNNLSHPYYGKGTAEPNREWYKIKNCGDIFLNQAPQKNGIAMFMQLSDTDLHKSAGVITSIEGNNVYVSSLGLGITAEKRGVTVSTDGRLYNETKSWNTSAAITAVDAAANKITVDNASNLVVGEHFYYRCNLTYMRDAEYGYVQLAMSGNTGKRPAEPRTGMMYLDTQINKPIWWNGSRWIDATGAEV